MTKPNPCALCPLRSQTTGFCADWIKTPRIAVVFRTPGKDDVASGVPLSGRMGWHIWKDFFEPFGLEKNDVLISTVLRCYPNGGDYPTGKPRVLGTVFCGDNWDQALKNWNPDVWGFAPDPAKLYATPAQEKFVKRAVGRAVELAGEGRRPCLLFGEEARAKFAPWLEGSVKQWQGHTWEGTLDELFKRDEK